MRDLRDPQVLGKVVKRLRAAGMSWEDVVSYPATPYNNFETCIEKYGAPSDLEPRFMEIQVR